MKIPLTNHTLFSTDWAAAERQAFLCRIPRTRRQQNRLLAPSLAARGVWMTDVSASDRRSVKAQLAGRGDYRAAWWRLNQRVHLVVRPQATLEQQMHAFHKRHHRVTIALLTLAFDYREVLQAIRQHGVAAGVRCAIIQCRSADVSQE